MPGIQIQFEAVDAASPTIQRLSNLTMEYAKNSDRFVKEIFESSNRFDTSLKRMSTSAKEAKPSIEAVKDATCQLASTLISVASVEGLPLLPTLPRQTI
jgi:hypothetical protein